MKRIWESSVARRADRIRVTAKELNIGDGKSGISVCLSDYLRVGRPSGRVRDVRWGNVEDRLPESTQCTPRGYKLKAGDSKVGKRQKQQRNIRNVNERHLKRDGAALIREQELWRSICFFRPTLLQPWSLPPAFP